MLVYMFMKGMTINVGAILRQNMIKFLETIKGGDFVMGD